MKFVFMPLEIIVKIMAVFCFLWRCSLPKNYPNPFRGQTTFVFKVNQPTKATLRIYNAQGSYVATAFSGSLTEGEFEHVWDGGSLPVGLYVANLYDSNGNLLQSGKLLKSE